MNRKATGATGAKAQTTALATQDATAVDMLDIVRNRIKAIKLVADAPPKTHGLFKYTPSTNTWIKIGDVTEVGSLLLMLGFLMEKETAYDKAAASCGMNEYPMFKWCGYGVAEWKHDIQVRIAIINHHNNLAELQDAEKELTTLLSQTDKLTMLKNKLGNTLGMNIG